MNRTATVSTIGIFLAMAGGLAGQTALFTNVDLTARLSAYGDQTTYWGGVNFGGNGDFYGSQQEADSSVPYSIWRSTVFPYENMANTFCYSASPGSDSIRINGNYHLEIDLIGIETANYQRVYLDWKIEKWHGFPWILGYTNPAAHIYATADLGCELPTGKVSVVEEFVASPWPQYGWTDCMTRLWDERDCFYMRCVVLQPVVWGVQQLREIKPDPIRPDATRSRVGEPINTISGDMDLQETDIAIPSPGVPLEFRRAYNSALDYSGPLGPRWSHNWNLFLTDTNTVFKGVSNSWKVLQTAEGAHYSFRRLSAETYESPFDADWTLTATNGAYRVLVPGERIYDFNSNGVLTAVSDLWGNRATLAYSNAYPNHLLTNVMDNAGRCLVFSYSSGKLTHAQVSGTNLSVAYAYTTNTAGELVSATRSAGAESQIVAYASDEFGRHCITQRVNAAGDVFAWEYAPDTNGLPTSKATRSLVNSEYYDTRLAHDTNGLSQTTVNNVLGTTNRTFQYRFDDTLKRIQEIRSGNLTASNWTSVGRGVKLQHDDFGNVTNELAYDNAVQEWLATIRYFDSQHHVTNEAFGYCVAPSNAWNFEWHPDYGTLTAVTDPEGHRAEMTYINGALSRIRVDPDSGTPLDTVFTYTTNGLLSAVTNANGHWIHFGYDGYGNRTSTVPQAGPWMRMDWDILGNLRQIVLPGEQSDTNNPPQTMARTIEFEPNALGWIRGIVWPDGTSESFAYDATGNITNHIDVAGRVTRYSWLPTRKLSSITRTLEGATNQDLSWSIQYDKQFNTLRIVDPLNRPVESYRLDDQDRPVTVTNLEGQAMNIEYGLDDFMRSVTRFDGTTVSNTFDGEGRLVNVLYPDSANSFGYLKNDLLVTASNEQGIVSNVYDGANRLTSSSSLAPNGTVSYTFFPAGQVSNVTSVAGTVTYGLDGADRVEAMKTPAGAFEFTYHANNGLVSGILCTNNGLNASISYDVMDRITAIIWRDDSNNVLRSFDYGFNKAGLIDAVTRENGARTDYTLDSLDRLTAETQRDAESVTVFDESISYDLTGNRTAKTRDGLHVSYGQGEGNRLAGWSVTDTNLAVQCDVMGSANEAIGTGDIFGQLWVSNAAVVKPTVSGTNFVTLDFPVGLGTQRIVAAICDVAGNTTYATSTVFMTVVTNAAYGYSAAGCQTSVVYRGADYLRTLNLSWDGQYRLTEARTNGVVAERYGFDALGRRAWTWDGAATNWHVYDGVQVVADVNTTGGLVRTYVWGPGIDNLLAMTAHTGATAVTYYAIKDHLGSVQALVNGSGAVVESYRFDAWGRVLGVYDGSGSLLTGSGIGNRYLWQGREYSWRTGLYYFRARWYDPVTGRWLSPDPIGIAGGLNMFVFAGNNPVNFRDPFGLCTDDPTIFGIGNLPRGPFPYVQVPSPWLDVPESIANAVPLVGNALLNALAWGVDNFAIDPSDPMAPYIAATFLFAPEFRLIQNASRGLTVKDWFRPGRTVVSNQLIEGPGATGATRTWAIKGGGGRLPFHYHIHQYNWYKPWLWFSQTPIIW